MFSGHSANRWESWGSSHDSKLQSLLVSRPGQHVALTMGLLHQVGCHSSLLWHLPAQGPHRPPWGSGCWPEAVPSAPAHPAPTAMGKNWGALV